VDKKTVLAIVLSFVVITGGMLIQTAFFAPSPEEIQATELAQASEDAASSTGGEVVNGTTTPSVSQNTTPLQSSTYASVNAASAWNSGLPGSFKAVEDSATSKSFTYQTNVFDVTFDTDGASVSSFNLRNHTDIDGTPVDIIFKGDTNKNAFLLYAGDDRTNPIDTPFNYVINDHTVTFSKTFVTINEDGSDGDAFTLTKTYTFGDDDYLFQVDIEVTNSVNKVLPLNFSNNAFTLAVEPQVGPAFTQMANNAYSYRKFYMMKDGKDKRSNVKLTDGEYVSDEYLSWAAIAGKYFSIIAIPDATNYTVAMVQKENVGSLVQSDSMFWTRPASKSASMKSTFRFYTGPQLKEDMAIYNSSNNNGFNLSGLNLDKAVDSSAFFGWLETILMFFLNLNYKIIPNYGIAIIIVTVLLKLVTNPLTKKSTESSARMAAISPKIKELQEKYKDNPDKLNKEMSGIYKKEGVNPISGCLPMLIQFPILLAFYGLLNRNFGLRGAMFIPGWIPDLSQPDTVATLGFIIPFIGNQVHLLPIFYTVSMIFSMKLTQGSQGEALGQAASTMKIMTYGMPIMFFFVLYSAPSGLLLYWSVMNAITILQTVYNTRKIKQEMASGKSKKVINFNKNKNNKKK